MNRAVRIIFVVSSLVVVLMVQRSMAQQGQISVNRGDGQQNYVIGPDGTYRVNDDGSLEQVDPDSEPALQGLAIPNINMPPNGGGNNGGGSNFARGNGNGAGGRNSAGGNGNRGGGFVPSPEQMQQKMRQASEDSLRKALGCSDQEWAVLLPKIQKIESLQGAVMPGSRLRAVTGGANAAASVVQLAARVEKFQKLVTGNDVPDAVLTQELASVREARDQVKVDLVQARKELTDIVTQRQEAILFERGILAD